MTLYDAALDVPWWQLWAVPLVLIWYEKNPMELHCSNHLSKHLASTLISVAGILITPAHVPE